jgi:hypothetical protein
LEVEFYDGSNQLTPYQHKGQGGETLTQPTTYERSIEDTINSGENDTTKIAIFPFDNLEEFVENVPSGLE